AWAAGSSARQRSWRRRALQPGWRAAGGEWSRGQDQAGRYASCLDSSDSVGAAASALISADSSPERATDSATGEITGASVPRGSAGPSLEGVSAPEAVAMVAGC